MIGSIRSALSRPLVKTGKNREVRETMISKIKVGGIINSLLKLESETGSPLSRTAAYLYDNDYEYTCPISNFAPGSDKCGRRYFFCRHTGDVVYRDDEQNETQEYQIFSEDDSNWWESLDISEQVEYLVAIEAWLDEWYD
jgi:hypothetical protein